MVLHLEDTDRKQGTNEWMHLAKCWGGKALCSPAGGLKEALLEEASLKRKVAGQVRSRITNIKMPKRLRQSLGGGRQDKAGWISDISNRALRVAPGPQRAGPGLPCDARRHPQRRVQSQVTQNEKIQGSWTSEALGWGSG